MPSLTAKLLALALLASTAGCASSNPSKAARSLDEAGRPAEAKPYAEIALARAQRGLASDHPAVDRRVYELARIEDALGNHVEAQQLYGRVLAIQTKSLGPESPKVGKTLHLLAGTYAAQGENTQAQNLYRRSLAIREKAVGLDARKWPRHSWRSGDCIWIWGDPGTRPPRGRPEPLSSGPPLCRAEAVRAGQDQGGHDPGNGARPRPSRGGTRAQAAGRRHADDLPVVTAACRVRITSQRAPGPRRDRP
jgi:tetratricopeptide (TPR) repeat protein